MGNYKTDEDMWKLISPPCVRSRARPLRVRVRVDGGAGGGGEIMHLAMWKLISPPVRRQGANPNPNPDPNPNPTPNLCEVDVFEGARHGPYEYNGWAGFHKAFILARAREPSP